MPIYEYECISCGEKFELRRGITDSDSEIKCPKCGLEDDKGGLDYEYSGYSSGNIQAISV